MARFLFTVLPFPGHINPSIAVAHALQQAGHEIAFYTGGVYRDVLEQEGWTFFPFEHLHRRIVKLVDGAQADDTVADSQALYVRFMEYQTEPFQHPFFVRGSHLASVYLETVLGIVPAQVADLQAVLPIWKPDVIVCDPDMWGPGLILSELQQVPIAILSYYASCLIPGRDTPPAGLGLPPPRTWSTRVLAMLGQQMIDFSMRRVRRATNAMRQSYGLAPISVRVHTFLGQMPLYLVTGTSELDYQRQDLPASVHYVGACSWDTPPSEQPLAWLDQLTPSQPLVYVSEGTTYVHTPIVLQAAAQGLANLSMHVLLSTGKHRDPAKLAIGPLASNLHIERWVPQNAVLSKASAFVTHGGATSIMSGLLAGVPLIVVPLQWEQADNAQRVVDAGAGLRLDPRHCTPQRLRAAVEQVVSEPSFRQAAQRLARACAHYGGARRAAELLTQLALTRNPPQIHHGSHQ